MSKQAVAVDVERGEQVVKFTCPVCKSKYVAPKYAKDFVCNDCWTKDYEWNYSTQSKIYDVKKDTYLVIPK